jgi:3-hydroxybutyrate dehydrogenase
VEVVVHVDGGARGNPGPAAAAAVVSAADGGAVLDEASRLLGVATNNVAEYHGVLLGLERARALGADRVRLVNDSELVARQLTGRYKVKHADLKPLHAQALAALRAFDGWSVESVPRARNAAADALVNAALDVGAAGVPGQPEPAAPATPEPAAEAVAAPAAARPAGARVVLLTGVAGGIGLAIAKRLAAGGMTVVGTDRQAPDDAPVDFVQADLTTRAGNRDAVQAALDRHGRLDAVIANAGVQHVAPVAEFPEDAWDTLIALMLTSPFLLARAAWPALAASGDGRFVAIASVHGLVASPFKAGYVSAKHGVLGLVKTLALEGAEHGIRASAICPGFVRTPLVEAQLADQAKAHGMSEDEVMEQVVLAPHAIKTLIEPDEVAEVAAFLLSPAGRAFTGAPVIMDQGWTAR